MHWQDSLRLVRIAFALGFIIFAIRRLNQGDSATAIWGFVLGGFVLFHAVIWDPITNWLSAGDK
jgi:hypothetical protein